MSVQPDYDLALATYTISGATWKQAVDLACTPLHAEIEQLRAELWSRQQHIDALEGRREDDEAEIQQVRKIIRQAEEAFSEKHDGAYANHSVYPCKSCAALLACRESLGANA